MRGQGRGILNLLTQGILLIIPVLAAKLKWLAVVKSVSGVRKRAAQYVVKLSMVTKSQHLFSHFTNVPSG